MKTKALVLIVNTVIVTLMMVNAQDKIYKKTNDAINCKVTEIGLDKVKYMFPDSVNDIIYVIGQEQVSRVVLENREEFIFKDNLVDPDNYLDNRKNALKVDFMSPLTGNTTLAYEHSIKPGRSYEISLGLIGLGIDQNDANQAGFFIKWGIKLIKSPDFYMRGLRFAHILKGAYIKPEIAFGYYAINEHDYDYSFYGRRTTIRESITTGALLINFGKQEIIDNSFLVDYYFGLGYGFDSDTDDGGYHYGYAIMSNKFPLAVQCGLKIGFLFK